MGAVKVSPIRLLTNQFSFLPKNKTNFHYTFSLYTDLAQMGQGSARILRSNIHKDNED